MQARTLNTIKNTLQQRMQILAGQSSLTPQERDEVAQARAFARRLQEIQVAREYKARYTQHARELREFLEANFYDVESIIHESIQAREELDEDIHTSQEVSLDTFGNTVIRTQSVTRVETVVS